MASAYGPFTPISWVIALKLEGRVGRRGEKGGGSGVLKDHTGL